MATSFRTLLSQNSTQVERPKPLPQGHYYGRITKSEFATSKTKQTPYVRFYLVAERAADDIDEDAMEGIDLSTSPKEVRKDYYITPGATYRLSDMLDAVIGDPDRSMEERIPECAGARVMFAVTTRKSDTSDDVYNDVTTIVAENVDEETDQQVAA